ncbi:MAG: ADOP family duplicated permease [Rudaea sp.]|nr:ADOP family duplicated permease [Rudaea sp.]
MISAATHELGHALRALANRPAFSALVIGVLASGLACVIFMLAMLDGFVLRPLPFAAPDELLQAGFRGDSDLGDISPVSSRDLLQIRHQLAGMAEVEGAARSTVSLSDLDRPERYNGAHVSADLFHVLGIAPLLGREFSDSDALPGAPTVAMLSYQLWRDRYGSDPAIVGKLIRIDARPATVIGVMPENFSFPRREVVWMPSTLVEDAKADGYSYWLVLRRRSGVGDAAVTSAFETWFADAARADPERFRDQHPQVEPLARMATDRTTRAMLGMMFAAVCMVLLVACANAANLLLTRTLGRRQELAVRVAVGASRRRLILHLLAESLLLTLIAFGIALVLANVGLHWQQAVMRQSEFAMLWLRFDIDARVIGLALAAALLTALITGVLPALRAGNAALSEGLREGTRSVAGGSFARVSRGLVIVEIALSCALLICVGTLVRGILALDHVDLGIDTNHLLTARVALPLNAYPDDTARLRIYGLIGESLRADTDVVDATVGTVLPGTWYNEQHDVLPVGAVPGDALLPQMNSGAVDDNFLGAYGIKLQQGRFFDTRDTANSPYVAVVDRNFSERFADGGPVLGRQFRIDPRNPNGAAVTATVIGVVGALRLNAPGDPAQPTMLTSLRQGLFRVASIAVRTRGDANAFAPRLNELMRSVDADTPLYWVRDYAAVIRNATFGERIVAQSFGAFGVIALILAGAGLYGVMVFTVGQRTREIGVRRALGAPAGRVLRHVFGRSMLLLGMGLVLGLAAGIPFARLLSGSLRTINGVDTAAVAVAVGVLILAAGLAVIVPARRALRVDPIEALRYE